MTAILVTGGAGYVGSHTALALAQAGFEPIVLDNCGNGSREAVKWGPLVVGDLSDGLLIRETILKYRVEAVLHFAAYAYVDESMTRPRQYFRNNVVNTLNLLEAQVDLGVNHIVVSSSCATYGVPHTTPIRETHAQLPVSPYGESKLFMERMLHWFGQAYGLGWMALRYFNAAGADPNGELGEEHEPETHLIPSAIQTVLGTRPQLEIYGSDYATADGTPVRDYIHVSDLADAHVLALQHLLRGGESTAFNIGTGRGYSVKEVIATVEQVSGRKVKVHHAPRRDGDPPRLVADSSRATRVLGWRPTRSDLETIVRTAWNWHTRRPAPTTEFEHQQARGAASH